MACLLYSTPSHVFIFTLINSRYLHHADISCSLSMTRLWFQSRWYYTKIITQEPWKMGKNRWAKVSFFGRRLGDIWQKYNCIRAMKQLRPNKGLWIIGAACNHQPEYTLLERKWIQHTGRIIGAACNHQPEYTLLERKWSKAHW